MLAIVREEDPTRPVTTANNSSGVCRLDETDFVDVYGFNYCCGQFAAYRAKRPSKPMTAKATTTE